jgi:hypothetical protein
MTYRRSNPLDAMRNAARWRTRAEVMRKVADETIDPAVRAMMLRIAADYDQLARRSMVVTFSRMVYFLKSFRPR